MENDWADEIVEKCRWMQGSIGALEMARQLRAAELRGRVAGMRELIKQVEDQQAIYGKKLEMLWAREKSSETDAKIERTENYMEALRYISEEWEDAATKLESPPTT